MKQVKRITSEQRNKLDKWVADNYLDLWADGDSFIIAASRAVAKVGFPVKAGQVAASVKRYNDARPKMLQRYTGYRAAIRFGVDSLDTNGWIRARGEATSATEDAFKAFKTSSVKLVYVARFARNNLCKLSVPSLCEGCVNSGYVVPGYHWRDKNPDYRSFVVERPNGK